MTLVREMPSAASVSEVEEARAWLAEVAHENLGTEVALRASGAWKIAFGRRPDGRLTGVSAHLPGGQWFLEAEGPAPTADLVRDVAGAVRVAGRWPSKVTVSGAVKNWLRPLLAEHGVVLYRSLHFESSGTCYMGYLA